MFSGRRLPSFERLPITIVSHAAGSTTTDCPTSPRSRPLIWSDQLLRPTASTPDRIVDGCFAQPGAESAAPDLPIAYAITETVPVAHGAPVSEISPRRSPDAEQAQLLDHALAVAGQAAAERDQFRALTLELAVEVERNRKTARQARILSESLAAELRQTRLAARVAEQAMHAARARHATPQGKRDVVVRTSGNNERRLKNQMNSLSKALSGSDTMLQAKWYAEISQYLAGPDSITVTIDGRSKELDAVECLHEAIKADPDSATAFSLLGISLDREAVLKVDKAVWCDDRMKYTLGTKDCLVKAIALGSTDPRNFWALGLNLALQETIKLTKPVCFQGIGKSEFTKGECFVHSIDLDPNYGDSYTQLFYLMKDDDKVRFYRPVKVKGKALDALTRYQCVSKASEISNAKFTGSSLRFMLMRRS